MPSPKYSLGKPIRKPFTSATNALVKSGTSTSKEVASCSSLPQMVLSTMAASVTSLVIGPIWSREEAKATQP